MVERKQKKKEKERKEGRQVEGGREGREVDVLIFPKLVNKNKHQEEKCFTLSGPISEAYRCPLLLGGSSGVASRLFKNSREVIYITYSSFKKMPLEFQC